jgi:hypothetical protein
MVVGGKLRIWEMGIPMGIFLPFSFKPDGGDISGGW